MRYPCSEEELLDALKARLEKVSGVSAKNFDECIRRWKQKCCVKLSGSEEKMSISPLKISDFEDNEKLPKEIFRHLPEDERLLLIELKKYSARIQDPIKNDYVDLKVTGMFTGKKREGSVTMIAMVFNASDELVGYAEEGFNILYDDGENMFDVNVGLPADERISAIEVRFTRRMPLFI